MDAACGTRMTGVSPVSLRFPGFPSISQKCGKPGDPHVSLSPPYRGGKRETRRWGPIWISQAGKRRNGGHQMEPRRRNHFRKGAKNP